MLSQITTILSGVALAACSVVGIRETEEPKFTVVAQIGDAVQIRQYGPRVAAETEVPGDEIAARNIGFQRLAGYIFGGNTTRTKIDMNAPVAQGPADSGGGGGTTIAMTAPVAQDRAQSGGWRIRFFMPAEYALADLPEPNDKSVLLRTVPAETYAVLRFSGARDGDAVAAKQRELIASLGSTRWQPSGEPVAWFYDPPWTIPALRRNEVAVPVTER
jgi:hypothetical protein